MARDKSANNNYLPFSLKKKNSQNVEYCSILSIIDGVLYLQSRTQRLPPFGIKSLTSGWMEFLTSLFCRFFSSKLVCLRCVSQNHQSGIHGEP